jgi:hypothetical protein
MADPRPTIPGAAAGWNCRLTARGYGSRLLRCLRVAYGVEIGVQEDFAANARTLYPLNRTSPVFLLSAVFQSWEEREAFNRWASVYMRKVATNQPVSGYLYVEVPARRFARYGVLAGPLVYGETIGDVSFPSNLTFVGAQTPVADSRTSYYRPASKDKTEAPHFYPSGSQKAGAESLEGTLYDPTPQPAVPEVAEPAPSRRFPSGVIAE